MTGRNQSLEGSVVYQEFSKEELQVLRSLAESESFSQGAEILTEGKIFPALWVVTSGQCEVVKSCGNGSLHQLAVIGPAGVFGEMSFFEPAPHSATVRALTKVETVRLSRTAFDELRVRAPEAAFKITSYLVRLLSTRLRTMDLLMCDLNERTSSGLRVAEWREFQKKLYGDWSF